MTVLCELKVLNRKDATIVVANRIFPPKTRQLVKFHRVQQVVDALAFEKYGAIRIEGEIPAEVKAMMNGESELDEEKEEPEEIEVDENPEDIEGLIELGKADDETVESVAITRDEVIAFTMKEMRDYMKENNIVIEGNSTMKFKELTNALLDALGFELLEDDDS